jgi:PAS domain S-box-containing protein
MKMKNYLPNNHYAIALDNVKEGIITMDTNFKIIYINPATSIILKKPKSKMIGSNVIQLLTNNSRSPIKKIFNQMSSNTLPFSQEITLPLNDRTLNTTFIKLLEDGSYIGSIIIMQDITESNLKIIQLKKLDEELKKVYQKLSHKTKLTILGQLAANLSHEISTPLTIILGYTSLLLNKVNPPDPLKKDLKIIQEEVLRICHITRKVLNFTHSPKLGGEKIINNKSFLSFAKRYDRILLRSQMDRNKT